MLQVEIESFGDTPQEASGQRLIGAVGLGLVGDERRVAPQWFAVFAPEAVERPARQLLARIPLALPEVGEALRCVFLAQAAEQVGGTNALGRPECVGVPFGAVRVVNRDEGRFTAHGQAHVAGIELGIDAVAERLDVGPLFLGVGLGDARRFPHALDLHGVREFTLALVGEAGDRCGRGGFRRAGNRDVAFAGEQAGGRIESDPSGSGQIDLGPGVQVGEIDLGAGGAVERFDIGHQLDQVTGHEARGQAEMAQHLHQQPGRVAARALGLDQRFRRRLHAGFQADDVADGALHALVEGDEKIDGGRRVAGNAVHESLEHWRGRQLFQEGQQFMAQARLIGEGELVGPRFEEEVERVDDRQFGDEIDLDLEFACLFRKDQAGEVVRLRILLPVDEVLVRRDLQRVAEDRRARVRRRAQPDDLGREADRPVVAIVRDVVEGNMDRHG